MKPAIGRIVHFRSIDANGSTVHPAIITRVWSETHINGQQAVCVNLTVFPDNEQPVNRSSQFLFLTERFGELADQRAFAFWPEKV